MQRQLAILLLLSATGCQLPFQIQVTKRVQQEPALQQDYCLCGEQAVLPAVMGTTEDRLTTSDGTPVPSDVQLQSPPSQSDLRLEYLESQLQVLEQQQESEASKEYRLQNSIDAMNRRVVVLTSEIDHWKQEVKRIERESVEQDSRDLESLNQLHAMLEMFPETSKQSSDSQKAQ